MHQKVTTARLTSSGKIAKHGLVNGANQRAATASSLIVNKGGNVTNKRQQLNADENSLSHQLIAMHN